MFGILPQGFHTHYANSVKCGFVYVYMYSTACIKMKTGVSDTQAGLVFLQYSQLMKLKRKSN